MSRRFPPGCWWVYARSNSVISRSDCSDGTGVSAGLTDAVGLICMSLGEGGGVANTPDEQAESVPIRIMMEKKIEAEPICCENLRNLAIDGFYLND